MNFPSGAQHEIGSGHLRAVVVGVGGGLRELTYGGDAILHGFAIDQMAPGGSGQVLMPWPNRIRNGRYSWEGRDLQLPLSEPRHGNAIHGLVRWSEWHAELQSPDRIDMAHRLHPQSGYPFTLDLRIEYLVADPALTVTVHAINAGEEALPFGAGFHPYLSAGAGSVDECELTLPAGTYLETDDHMIPTSRRQVDGTPQDFRKARKIGATVLDTPYANLQRAGEGRATVVFCRSDYRVRLWMDSSFGYVMAFSGDTLQPALRRRSLAIEPMTCAPNAFVSGDGLIRLEPGQEWTATWGIEVAPAGGGR